MVAAYICPVLVSFLVISATLVVTLSILHWNYVENNQRKISKKMIILNHWYSKSNSNISVEFLLLIHMQDKINCILIMSLLTIVLSLSLKGKGETCPIRFRKDLPGGSGRPSEHRIEVKKNELSNSFSFWSHFIVKSQWMKIRLTAANVIEWIVIW